MKINGEYVFTEVAGETIAVPIGDAGASFSGIVKLNKTGSYIWEMLKNGSSAEEIAEGMVKDFTDVDYDTALACTTDIINNLIAEGIATE